MTSSTTPARDVSILIPAWDEEASIGRVVGDAMASCRLRGITAECLVCVDPRTRDATAEVAAEAGAQVVFQRGRGLTGAVLQAAAEARAEVCAVLDGDGQHDGNFVARLVAPVVGDEVDLVVGARDGQLLRSGFGTGPSAIVRYGAARLLRVATRAVIRQDLADPLTGMFACRRTDLLALCSRRSAAPPTGYKLLLGLLVGIEADRVRQLTVPFLNRTAGESKLGTRVAVTTAGQIVYVFAAHRLAGLASRSPRTERRRIRRRIGRNDLPFWGVPALQPTKERSTVGPDIQRATKGRKC